MEEHVVELAQPMSEELQRTLPVLTRTATERLADAEVSLTTAQQVVLAEELAGAFLCGHDRGTTELVAQLIEQGADIDIETVEGGPSAR